MKKHSEDFKVRVKQRRQCRALPRTERALRRAAGCRSVGLRQIWGLAFRRWGSGYVFVKNWRYIWRVETICRVMKINGIRPVRTGKYKVTTNSNHSLGIVLNILNGDFAADTPNGLRTAEHRSPRQRLICGGPKRGPSFHAAPKGV